MLTAPMMITLATLFVTVCFFVYGKIRSDLVALFSLVTLMLTKVLSPQEALVGFSSNVSIMLVSVFIIGGAIVRTGLAMKISRKILSFAGTNQYALFMLIMLMTAAIGSIVSNTGTVAIMMPVVINLATNIEVSPSRFLMPLAFMSSMGGLLTLVGNSANLVANEALVGSGYPSLSFFSFLPIGLICITFGLLVLCPVTAVLLSRLKAEKSKKVKVMGPKELVNKYHLAQSTYILDIPNNSPIIGKLLSDLALTSSYHITIHAIRRQQNKRSHFSGNTFAQVVPGPTTKLQGGDTLFVIGPLRYVTDFMTDYALKLISSDDSSIHKELSFESIGACELVLLSTSRLVGRTVSDAGLREQFSITLLGIQRNDKYLIDNIRDEVLLPGDALFVQGSWETISHLENKTSEWVVVGRPLDQSPASNLERKIPYLVAILIGMVLTMALGILPTITSVMVAAVLIIAGGCFKNIEEAYSFINWESVVLIACMLPVSLALEKTGLTNLAATRLIETISAYGPHLILIVVYAIASCMNMFINTIACALLTAPIAMTIATSLEYSPLPFIFAVATASSACFASPFSTPSNALVMSAGRYTFMDYIRIGFPMQVLLGIIMVIAIPLLFPF